MEDSACSYTTFDAIRTLSLKLPTIPDGGGTQINIVGFNIVGYDVTQMQQFSFLQYLLIRKDDEVVSSLNFPNIFVEQHSCAFNTSNTVMTCIATLFEVLKASEFELFADNVVFAGFHTVVAEDDPTITKVYAFFDLSACQQEESVFITRKTLSWFCILDEIVNHRHVCGIPVHADVSGFFLENHSFCFLQNFESPTVGYLIRPTSMLDYYLHFGPTQEETKLVFVADWVEAVTRSIETYQGRVIRVALRLGTMKLCLQPMQEPMPHTCEDPEYDSLLCIGKYILARPSQKFHLSEHLVGNLPPLEG